MSFNSQTRVRVVEALNSLVGWGNNASWQGNVEEVGMQLLREGHGYISDYIIRAVLKERGSVVRRGQYRVTRHGLQSERISKEEG